MDDKLLTPEQAAALLNLKANTPPLFLSYLREEHPELLDPLWQRERIQETREIYGEKRVIIG